MISMSIESKTEGDECYQVIYDVAKKSRIVVFTEQAYDVIDEISRSSNDLNKVLDGLQKLSRLATKVYNNLADIKGNNDVNDAVSILGYWATDFQKFIDCLLKSADQKKLSSYVKAFATLSISPDSRSLKIKEVKNKS